MPEFAFDIVKQISVDLPNEPGSFAKLAEALASANVLIQGISVEAGYSVSRVHFVVDAGHIESAARVLAEQGEHESMKEILAVTILERKYGQIARIARILADAGINIDAIYLTSAAEGTKPTIYISATRESAQDVLARLESALSK